MKVTPKVGWRYSTYHKHHQGQKNLSRNDDTFGKCEGQNSKIEWYHRATDDSQSFLCIHYHCRSGSPASRKSINLQISQFKEKLLPEQAYNTTHVQMT